MRVYETHVAAQQRDPMPLQVPADARDFQFAHGVLPREQLGHRRIGQEVDAQSIEFALTEAREKESSFTQSLAGERAV